MSEIDPWVRSQVELPRLGVGTMTWGRASGRDRLNHAKLWYGDSGGPDQEEWAFYESVAAGVTLFDTAAAYSNGACERRVGELAAGTAVLIATKFPPSGKTDVDEMPWALGESLRRLRRTSIDLYQHHFPIPDDQIRHLMGLMADAVEAGRIRSVGVSNYSADQMRLAHAALEERGVALASNQVKYNLLHRLPENNGVMDACRELGVTLIAHQPLANGALTGKYIGQRPRGLRRFKPVFRRGLQESTDAVVALLREIGARHNATPGQVALRWLIEKDMVLPIPGAKDCRQAIENAHALSFTLSLDECRALDDATVAWPGGS